MKVLVVTADRALRATLSCLLRLEADLEVWDCSPREADSMLARIDPEVVLANGTLRDGLTDRRVVRLAELAPYEALLRSLREPGV